MYAIIRTAEFYGPRTETQIVAFASSKRAADDYAGKLEADEVADYGCQALGHNQASGWGYTVRRINARTCGRGYQCAPMYRGVYLPAAEAFAQRDIVLA